MTWEPRWPGAWAERELDAQEYDRIHDRKWVPRIIGFMIGIFGIEKK